MDGLLKGVHMQDILSILQLIRELLTTVLLTAKAVRVLSRMSRKRRKYFGSLKKNQ
jgi:hypothetical protein